MNPLEVRSPSFRTASAGLSGAGEDLAAHGHALGTSGAVFGPGPVGGLLSDLLERTLGALTASLESVVTDLNDAGQALGQMDTGYRRAENLSTEAVSQATRADSPATPRPSPHPYAPPGTAWPA
ncbi:hypothetical protein ACFY19_15190 [Streptosporangium saharense]|uniref:hypothetical protein n=1 Tax=Streptosporangium saharense TaxID=1706840 RepID=UPI00369923C4